MTVGKSAAAKKSTGRKAPAKKPSGKNPALKNSTGKKVVAEDEHAWLMRASDLRVAPERRQEGGQTVLGPRAERTRQRLIDSAWKLFCDKGYLATSMSDIAEDAGVSLGTVYQYFAERNDIVAVIVVDVIREMLASGVDQWDPHTGRLGLRRVISPYVEGYARHADFFEIWQCVTHVDVRMRALYRHYHRSYQQRFAKFLAEGRDEGLVRSDLDPFGMATAMTLMLERYCFEVFVMSPTTPPVDHGEVTDLLTSLWADAIKLQESGARRKIQGPKKLAAKSRI